MLAQGGITVAIDGPAGAGKSTVAKQVAQALGFVLVDTGAIYRSVALLAKREGLSWDDEAPLLPIVRHLAITFSFEAGINRVFIEHEDVTDKIRTGEISRGAAAVSSHPGVRQGLLAMQRHLAGQGGAVLEGRDIGTVVCPEAPVKFFLDATPQERARRRYEELRSRGEQVELADVLQEIEARDALDRARAHAPLKAADDAEHLDSTKLSADEVIATIVAAVRRRQDAGSGDSAAKPEPGPVTEIFSVYLPKRLEGRPDIAQAVRSAYRFVITGANGGSWWVDLREGAGRIYPSEAQAPCSITLAADDFVSLIEGRTNAQMAFLSGKLKVTGDIGLALKLGAIFG
jgi:cytidylate kinase